MSVLDAALDYIGQGLAVVRIPHRQKGPLENEWQNLRITVEDARLYFNGGPQNIGIILGRASGGLADLDLDRPEAIAAAPFLLPPTATFGHKSKRASHWIYRTNLASTQDRAAIKFLSVDKGGLLEVRMGGGGAGAQTVFPPSTHVSGEPITWEHTDNKIHEIDGDKLLANARQLAAAAQLAIAYPKAGGRHDAAFVLGGFLARCNLGPSWIKLFIEAVAVASGQPSDKRRDMIRTAADGTKSANKAGFPLLAETFGKEVAKKCADWLGYQGGSDDRACDSEARGNDGLAASLGKEAAVSLNDFRACP
jgi:Bifunctional DNA primase/polymerase, N-terminal